MSTILPHIGFVDEKKSKFFNAFFGGYLGPKTHFKQLFF